VHKLILSLGANLGDRETTLKNAISALVDVGIISDIKVSSIYETEPVGYIDQPAFLNMAVSGLTSLTPEIAIFLLKSTEYLFGRKHRERWHERELDIDIIFWGDEIIETEKIQIPHPRMHERNFVLDPISEIEPGFIHPVLGKSIKELLKINS